MSGVVKGQVLDPVVATFAGDCARARVRRVERTVRQFLEGGEVVHLRHRLRVAREPSPLARLVAGLAGGAPPPVRALLRLADAHAPDAADFPPLPVPARVSRVDPVAVGLRRGAALPHGAGAPVEPRVRVHRQRALVAVDRRGRRRGWQRRRRLRRRRRRRRRASAARVQHPDLELLAVARRHARRRVVERVVQPARAELRRRGVVPVEAAHRVRAGERKAGDDRRHVCLGDKVFLRRPQQCLAFGGGHGHARPYMDDPVTARDVARRLAVGGVCQVVDHRPALRRRIEGRRVEGPS